jgi:glycosyltransferase involved in cell wall biosynthesis
MSKPTLHILGLFHTIPNSDYHHCAFTQKAFRIPKMMQPLGYRCIEYHNGTSESAAENKVQILTEEELFSYTGKHQKTAFHGNTAVLGSRQWTEFDKRLKTILPTKLKDGDIVCHPFGRAHMDLVKMFPNVYHVETGIGYPDADFGAFRIFESYAWMHYHYGKTLHFDGSGRLCFGTDNLPVQGSGGKEYNWIVPNYFDLDDWDYRPNPGKYLLYYGRICPEKGLDVVKAIADAIDEEIWVAGQGSIDPWKHPRLKYIGPVTGKARSELVGNAKALLMPTRYIEPFGGAGVEGQLCGTPLIASNFGCFAETVEHGKSGYRCNTLGDYVEAIQMVNEGRISRAYTAQRAQNLYSMEACAKRFDAIFEQIADLRRPGDDPLGSGWYHRKGHIVHLPY